MNRVVVSSDLDCSRSQFFFLDAKELTRLEYLAGILITSRSTYLN